MSSLDQDTLRYIRAKIYEAYDNEDIDPTLTVEKYHYQCGIVDGLEKALDIIENIRKEYI